MPWFLTPHGPHFVVEPGTIDEYERRDYVVMTAQQVTDYFAGVAIPDPPSFATEAEVTAALNARDAQPIPDGRLPARLTDAALRAAFRRKLGISSPEAYKQSFYTFRPQVMGCDPVDQLIWYTDQFGLYTSTPGVYGQSFSANKSYPLEGSGESNPAFQIRQVLRFKNKIYCYTRSTVANAAQVYRADPAGSGNTAYVWTLVMTGTPGSSAFYEALYASPTTMIAVDYGDPVEGAVKTARVRRTTDGTTWTTVHTFDPTVRHGHSVKHDDWTPGHWEITYGDGVSPCLIESDDDGLTWTTVPAMDSLKQACRIVFDAKRVYYFADANWSNVYVRVRGGSTLVNISHGDHRRISLGQDEGLHRRGGITTGTNQLTDFYDVPFTPEDVGCRVFGTGIPNGTTITAYTSADTVTMSANATATNSASSNPLTYKLQRSERPMTEAFLGDVDLDTGIIYFLANAKSLDLLYRNGAVNGGYRPALFYIPQPGAEPVLLDVPPGDGNYSPKALLIFGGRIHYGCASRPLLQLADIPG